MIHVRYSNRIEELVAALAGALPPPGDIGAMFDGPWLVIPSRPLELYVALELARRRGISGNMDTLSVRGAFARLCAEAHPDVVLIDGGHVVGELLALLSEPALENRYALGELQDYLVGAGTAPDAVNRRRVDLARALGGLFDAWTLTRPELLATWRGAGASGDTAVASPLARAEQAIWTGLFGVGGRFQRRGEADGRRYLTLDAYFAENLDRAWRPPAAIHFFGLSAVPRGLQYALSRLASQTSVEIYAVNPCREFWEDLETKRAPRRRAPPRRREAVRDDRDNGRQLQFTALVSPAGAAATASQPVADVALADGAGDNPLLRAWGHAGRESTRLLNQLSDGDFQSCFVAPRGAGEKGEDASADGVASPTTLLVRLQQDMLDRQPGRRDQRLASVSPDGSLRVMGAPNPRRELETVAAEIWEMVEAGTSASAAHERPPLRFSDVAVLIAGGDEPYLSLARAVFREARDLPHAVIDQPIASGSHLVEAVLALLALPLGTCTRREVLDVITHPNVLANVRARFPEADPQTWLRLCEGLGIAHGADQAALADTYIDGDLFNWDQGLRRLALGLFARGPRSGADDLVPLPPAAPDAAPDPEPGAGGTSGASGYLPAEVAADARADADALGLLVRSLLADARFARSARLTLAQWTDFVRAVMSAYVMVITPDDEKARLRVFSALDQIAVQAPPDLAVTLGTALELLRGALGGLRGTRGQMLGGGVTVGTLAALRALPFRVIYVVGLDADRFPVADRPSPFEAGIDRPRPGDVNPRQQDRYLFLETMLAARDSLILSYVDRDALTGELREPSAVVLELLDELQRGYLSSSGSGSGSGSGSTSSATNPSHACSPSHAAASIFRRIPLHRDEDPRLHAAFPAAAAEARARLIGDALRESVPAVAGLSAAGILGALSPETRQSLSPVLRTLAAPTAARASLPAPAPMRTRARVVRLIDLRRFLECPLQGSARIFLGLRDLPDDTEARETGDEPFEVPRWLERNLLGEVLCGAWAATFSPPSVAALPQIYDATIGRYRHGRAFPAGLFRANVRRRHLRVLEQWLDSLAAGGAAPRGPARRVCFGRPEPFSLPAERRAAIRLTVDLDHDLDHDGQDELTVELHGTTEPQIATDGGSGSLVLATSADKDNNDKDSLRAFLDHLALAASAPEGQPPLPFVGAVCRPSRDGTPISPHSLSWEPLTADRARAYLTDLVRELLSGAHAYLFPCEAVFRSFGAQLNLVDLIDQVRADPYYRAHSSSNYGPVPDPFDYPTPSSELAERYASSRFGLLRAWQPQPQPQSQPRPRPRSKRGGAS